MAEMDANPATDAATHRSGAGPTLVKVTTEDEQWSDAEFRAHMGWAAMTAATLLGLFCLLRFLPTVGWPLVLASFGAYLLNPVVTALAARGVPRSVGTGLLLGSGLLLGAVVIVVVTPLVVAQAARLPGYAQAVADRVAPWIESRLGAHIPSDFRELTELARTHIEQVATQVIPTAGKLLGGILGGSLSLLSFVLGALVVPVVGYGLLRDWPTLVSSGLGLVPPQARPIVRSHLVEVDEKLAGFIRGQLTMAAVLSTLYSAALSLIGLKLAIVIGLITGIGNLVPYAGTATGILLATAFCAVDFGFDHHLALVVGTYALLVAADSVFITPNVVGDKVGLSSAAVIVAVLVCGALFGFAGVLLAVPSAAVLRMVVDVLLRGYRQSRLFREG